MSHVRGEADDLPNDATPLESLCESKMLGIVVSNKVTYGDIRMAECRICGLSWFIMVYLFSKPGLRSSKFEGPRGPSTFGQLWPGTPCCSTHQAAGLKRGMAGMLCSMECLWVCHEHSVESQTERAQRAQRTRWQYMERWPRHCCQVPIWWRTKSRGLGGCDLESASRAGRKLRWWDVHGIGFQLAI